MRNTSTLKRRENGTERSKGIYELYIKRSLDCVLATCAVVVLSPVMAFTAIAVKKNLGSPILFTQKRPGKIDKKTGQPVIFKLYKFRSMLDLKDKNGKELSDEERLTPFGEKLRNTSLDELPELFNIIKGDMAVVGPRPLLVKYLPLYNAEQARRHEVRPGLTGLAQVHGRNSASWDEKFMWDIKYVDNVSFIGDLKIILDTIRVVLKHEGISAKGSATMPEFTGNQN